MIAILIQLLSGALGGNAAGAVLKNFNLGTLGNSVAGILGGGIGGAILSSVLGSAAAPYAGMDIGSILSNVAGGGVGGAVLLVIVGVVKGMLGKK